MSSDEGFRFQGSGVRCPLWRRLLVRFVLILALAPFAVWGVLAFVHGSWPRWIDQPLAVLFALGSAAVLLLLPTHQDVHEENRFFLSIDNISHDPANVSKCFNRLSSRFLFSSFLDADDRALHVRI